MNTESIFNHIRNTKNWIAQHRVLTSIIVGVIILTPLILSRFSIGSDLISLPSSPRIVSVSPEKNAKNAGIFSAIQVVFSKELTPEEKATVRLSSSPSIIGIDNIQTDSKTFIFSPSLPLRTNQTYTVSLQYTGKQYSWSFTTTNTENVSAEEQERAQSVADENFGKIWKDILAKYPWYNNSLRTKQYFVYFDVENAEFVAKIYVKQPQSQSTSTQVEQNKRIITSWVKSLGNNADTHAIKWVITPVF